MTKKLKRLERSQWIASILLKHHHDNDEYPEKSALTWRAAYELERFFGVDEESPWKSVAHAVRTICEHCHQPGPFVLYQFTKHQLVVMNGNNARVVQLRQLLTEDEQ